MAHPNEELARRGYDAFSNGDIDALRWLPTIQSCMSPAATLSQVTTKALTRCSAFSGQSRSVLEVPSGSPCMMLSPTASMPSGSTSLRANERGAAFTASRPWCSTYGMAWSLRPGRTTTTSMQPTSSGRRTRPSAPHPPRLRFAPPLGPGPRGRLLDGQLGQRERLQPLIRNRLTA